MVIVGAGIGGLAAALCLRTIGARVTVLEQAHAIGEVGAGIQLAPNATRALAEMGVADLLAPEAVAATMSVRRRWQDGRVLGRYPLGADVEQRFGTPYWHAHRADVHAALLRAATRRGRFGEPAVLRLTETAQHVEPGDEDNAACVVTGSGRHHADVLIGADGIHSRVREALAAPDAPRFSGDVAYRALIPVEAIRPVAELAELTRDPELNIWLGPHCHLVHYWVRHRALLNLVAIVPGTEDTPESWSAAGDKPVLLDALAGWDNSARSLVAAAPAVNRWAVYDREPLPSWTSGRVALLGDSCHAMVPYQAQGAAQALEDAVALARALRAADRRSVPEALAGYEQARHARATAVQRASRHNRELFHMPDGPEQEARDVLLRNSNGDFDSYAWLWGGVGTPENTTPRETV